MSVITRPPAVRPAHRPGFSLKKWVPIGYLSPTVVLIVGLMVIPVVMVITYSFKDNVIVSKNPVLVGLANYTKVLTDEHFLQALQNTLVFIVVSTVAHLLLGLTFAMMLNSKLLGGVTKALFRVVYVLPWLFTVAVIAVIWRLMLDPYGVINYLLQAIGFVEQEVDWLG